MFEGNAPRVVLPFKELLDAVEVGALLEEDVFSRSISVCFCVEEVLDRLLVEVSAGGWVVEYGNWERVSVGRADALAARMAKLFEVAVVPAES